jgi:CubicO group peptidase (beta-lactamase class C family)
MNHHKLIAFFVLFYLVQGCKTPDVKPTSLGEAMVQQADKTFAGTDIGYAFMMMQNGQVVAQTSGGLKSRAIENQGALPFTIDTKMSTGSSTKTITALAFMKLAAQKGIKPSDKIIDYLPPQWRKGQNIDLITFANLMTHTSGLRGVGNTTCRPLTVRATNVDTDTWLNLKDEINQGVLPENYNQYCYYNPNMCLLRVLIPSILGYQFTGNDDTDSINTGQMFLEYMQKEIFEKVGLKNISGSPFGLSTFTYVYEYPSLNNSGSLGYMSNERLGAGGLHLSIAEYTQVYHSVFGAKDGRIVSPKLAEIMLNNDYGLFSEILNSAEGTKYYFHDGLTSMPYCDNCNYQAASAVWLQLSDGITCTLFVNAGDTKKFGIVGGTNFTIQELILIFYNRGLIAMSK